jgi:hypothetical protein
MAIAGRIVGFGVTITSLMWFYRAYWNLPALGARSLNYSPGWAVGYFFIPILNLFRPYQVAREIDYYSNPSSAPQSALLIPVWWIWELVDWITTRVFIYEITNAVGLEETRYANQVAIVASAVGIVAFLLLMLLIRRITRNQVVLNRMWLRQAASNARLHS